MYTKNFIDASNEKIVEVIRENGYFAFEKALTNQYVEMLLQEIDFDQFLVNTNDVGVVFLDKQRYLTHCLAKSKRAYNIITSTKVLDICKKHFFNRFMLVNQRIFQTWHSHAMAWHTDNNLQIDNRLVGKHDMPGLLFIFYLSDVTKNAFQYIKDSHKWSHKYSNEIYLSNNLISSKYEKDIVTLQMPKGSLVICNTKGVHRAEPFQDSNYVRTTLIFQIDEVGDTNQNSGHGEKNLINTEYMDNISKEVMDYLGFGCKRDYPPFPNSSFATITPRGMIALQKQLLPLIMKAFVKRIIITLLPYKAVVRAKRIAWRIIHRNSKH